MDYTTSNSYDSYLTRKYDLKNTKKLKYMGICITNRITNKNQKIAIIVYPVYSSTVKSDEGLPVWAIILIVIGVIIFLVITFFCTRTEEGREFCKCFFLICFIFLSCCNK